MRVIAGRYGGRPLEGASAAGTRPTSDRVREAVFSILGDVVVDARVLDLYAGTGAVALEALSRGARHAVCVERSRKARRTIEANVAALGVAERVTVVPADALAWTAVRALEAGPFDVVWADPPYAEPLEPLMDVVGAGWWTSVFAVEHARSKPMPEPPGGPAADRRTWGDTAVSFFWRT